MNNEETVSTVRWEQSVARNQRELRSLLLLDGLLKYVNDYVNGMGINYSEKLLTEYCGFVRVRMGLNVMSPE